VPAADTAAPPAPEAAPEPGPPAGEQPPPNDPPVAQVASVAEAVSLEKLVGLWPAVLDQVRTSGSELLSHVLAAARPVAVNVEEAVVEVGFPASAAFNKRKAEGNEARDRFADAVKSLVGTRLRPVYVLLEGDEVETPPEAKLSEDELIELMRTEFDAEDYVAEPEGEAEPKEEAG
jgi:hypothetical protein